MDDALSALLGGSAGSHDLPGGRIPSQPADPELQRLLSVAQQIRDALSTAPSPAAQQRHLRRLAEEAAKPAGRGTRAPAPARRFPRFLLRPAMALAATFLVAGPFSVAFAAQDALPGDALYRAKLAIERMQLAVERDPAQDARLHLHFARERREELGKLAAAGRGDGPEVSDALENLSAHEQTATKEFRALEAKGEAPPSLEGRAMKVLSLNAKMLRFLFSRWECTPSDASDPQCSVLELAQESNQQSRQAFDPEPSPSPSQEPSPSPTSTAGTAASPSSEPTTSPAPTTSPGPSQSPQPSSEPTPTSEPTTSPGPSQSPQPSSEPTPTSEPTTSPGPSQSPQPSSYQESA